jgi:hypothetical protein
MSSHNKFLSFARNNTVTESSSSTFIVANNRIYEQEVGDVAIIDLPSTDTYDLLHYRKTSITSQNVSFRYKGQELIKAYKQHKQNVQFYKINNTWFL